MKFCKLADVIDWQEPGFEEIASLLMEGGRNRKAWEFIQVYRGLKHLGLLNGESRAIGLGVGHENLIYLFTNVCQEVIATDLYESQDWSTAAMAVQDIYECSPIPYRRERLSVRHMDMTQIEFPDDSFDFVWSCCAIEHVHNFRDLHRVYQEIHRVLKPGGIAALTTEFNTTAQSSYEPNMLFTDQAWVSVWLTGENPLVQGFELLDPPDYQLSDQPENQPKLRRQPQDAIQVYCNDIILNSISFFLKKTGEFSRAYDASWLAEFWQHYQAGWDAYRAGKFGEAEVIYKKILQAELEPRLKVRAMRRLVDALFAQAKLDEAREVCQAALPDCENFGDEDHLMPLAIYCWKLGLEKDACLLYQKIENLPSALIDLVIQSRLGQAKYYEKLGDYEKALELVGRAEQEIVPGAHTEALYKPEIYFRTGLIYEKMGQTSPAIRFYRLAIEISAAKTEFQVNCYRRLTTCLETEMQQLQAHADRLEAANRWMQSSKFWKLRSVVVGVKNRVQGRDRSPSF